MLSVHSGEWSINQYALCIIYILYSTCDHTHTHRKVRSFNLKKKSPEEPAVSKPCVGCSLAGHERSITRHPPFIFPPSRQDTHKHTYTQMLCFIILTPLSDLKASLVSTVCTVQFRQGQ